MNLALHVTGQRADGYHLLDTLVAFADVGDWVTLQRAAHSALTVTGPEGGPALEGPGNIVWTVKDAVWPEDQPLVMALEKRLPVASGIGGGSADAAACYRGLLALGAPERPEALLEIGADVPMCVPSQPARVQGIGEVIDAATLPELPALLINPRVAVSTPVVFRELATKVNDPLTPERLHFSDKDALISWLEQQRNDLEGPAMGVAPQIAEVLHALQAASACRLARMSGSGATCFGLFDNLGDAHDLAAEISGAHPDWWVAPCLLGSMAEAARPVAGA